MQALLQKCVLSFDSQLYQVFIKFFSFLDINVIKDKSVKRHYKKKRKFYNNRHTKKSNTSTTTSTLLINQVNPTTSISTDLPGTSLSSKKLKLISNNSASNNNESVSIPLIEMMVTTASKQFVAVITQTF